jgi:chemotaxis protein histidine kinase CheA
MKYHCEYCNYETNSKAGWCNHKKTLRHQKFMNNPKDYINQHNIELKEQLNNVNKNDLLLEKLKNSETINEMLNQTIIKLQQDGNKLMNNYEKQVKELQEDKNKLQEDKNKLQEDKNKLQEMLNQTMIKSQEDKNKLQDIICRLEEQNSDFIKELKLDRNELKSEREELKSELNNEKKYSKQVINNAGNLVGKSMSAIQYITQNYCNAPKLSQLNDYSDISENEQKLIDNLIFYHNKGLLHEYIGNYIIKHYKKDNPMNQSLWNTDSDRLNYIVRELIISNNLKDKVEIEELDNIDHGAKELIEWKVDKRGIRVAKYIIEPLLLYIKNICDEYIKNNHKKIAKSLEKSESWFKKIEAMAEINSNIKNKELQKNINKYISSHFYLNNKLSLK